MIKIAYFVYQDTHQRKNDKGGHDKVTINEKTDEVTEYLLEVCYGNHRHHLSDIQVNRIKSSVKERLEGTMQKPGFFEMLDKPFRSGGVGLNVKTAKAITEEIELILILGFGIVQNREEQTRRLEKEKEMEEEKEKINQEVHAAKIKEEQEKLKAAKMPIEALKSIDDLVNKIKKEASGESSEENNSLEKSEEKESAKVEEAKDELEKRGLETKMKDKAGYVKKDIKSELSIKDDVINDEVDAIKDVDYKEVVSVDKPNVSLSDVMQAAQKRDEEAKKD